jgi:adenine-specific DNA-methyltransferase
MAKGKSNKSVDIESIRHKDRRANIPTEELRDFVAQDEAKPKTILYPRDPSLDPQLVWKGKDEQDSKDLEVPAVPVYIQEKIHPKHIIEDLRAQVKEGKPSQLDFFSDFNGLQFEELVEFYEHEQNWTNRMILGDSLLVMTSLAEKEGLKGKVQMIYIDPPYGIKFGSNWQVSTRKRDVKDGSAGDATRQPEQIKAFRDTWKLGVHSYLAYLRDRLVVARDLLTETGSVFVQIGDENVHLVRSLIDEVFGSENFIAEIIVSKTAGASMEFIDTVTDYVLWYGKYRERTKYRHLFLGKESGKTGLSLYKFVELPDGSRRLQTASEANNLNRLPPNSRIFRMDALTSQTQASTTRYVAEFNGKKYESGKRQWATPPSGLKRLILANRVREYASSIGYVRFLDDFPVTPLRNYWDDTGTGSFTEQKIYVVQTNTKIIERCILMTTDPGDLVLDPTCGSGTTAYMAEEWGRRWITVDTSRVALALAHTRLMAARFPYYLLADSPEGIKKETELTGRTPPDYKTGGDIRKGFVYKRVPHITLKSIANNPDIKEGMAREEIDTAVARYAEMETLYDQPYEDNRRIRVTGPFTVESLSPHRVVAVDEERPSAETEAQKEAGIGQFETVILDNLKKAGVQNTVRNERLKFDHLDPYPGEWLHAEGEYTEKDGKAYRVAVCIGPEHGTVGPELVKEAAKEAVKGVGFDLLVICGFAFDPHVSEEAKRYGKLNILITRMNPDLAMGDELLKTTGAGNLFMVFGEPDVDIKKRDGKVTLEIKGVDVYDPTTGQIRSNSTDDIACWFIDTDYNGESFFVRHAYFTGAEEPYDKLKRALRAEINEAAWSSLYSTISRPFDLPKTGKIAIKVINHYGDEVLKVYEVREEKP